MLVQAGVALVVEVVEEARQAPQLFVLAEFAGIGTHGRLYRQHVPAQALTLGPFRHESPGLVASLGLCRHRRQLSSVRVKLEWESGRSRANARQSPAVCA